MRQRKLFSVSSLLFYFLLIFLGIFVFYHFTEIEDILEQMTNISPLWFLLAFITQSFTYFFTALVYSDLLVIYNQKNLVNLSELFRCSIISLFLNQVIPIGGISGNSFLIYYLTTRKVAVHRGVSIVTLEIFTYYLVHTVLLILGFVYLFWTFHGKVAEILTGVGLVGLILFSFLNFLAIFLGSKKMYSRFKNKIGKNRFINFVLKHVKSSLYLSHEEESENEWESPFEILKNKKRLLVRPLFWHLVVILLDSLTIYFLFWGFGFSANFLSIVIGLLLAKVIAMISISPGALVLFEGAMVLFYTTLSIPIALVVVVTIFFRFFSFWLPMPVGLFLYKKIARNESKNLSYV